MSQQLFVDREEELRFLTERYRTPGPECLVLYGRRRVGKTALLARFLEDAGGIYFLASEEGDEGNIREFSHYAAQYLDDPHFGDVKYPDWQSVFGALVRHRSFTPESGGKPVLVIDEFPKRLHDSCAPVKSIRCVQHPWLFPVPVIRPLFIHLYVLYRLFVRQAICSVNLQKRENMI